MSEFIKEALKRGQSVEVGIEDDWEVRVEESFDDDNDSIILVTAHEGEDANIVNVEICPKKGVYGAKLTVENYMIEDKKQTICINEEILYQWAKMYVAAIEFKRESK